MSSKIRTVRQSIATALDTISGLRVYSYDADDPQTPAALVRFPKIIDRVAFNGLWRYEVPVLLLAQRSSDRTADAQLEAFTDTIIDLTDSDLDLGGNIDSSQLMDGPDGYKITKIGDLEYLCVTLMFEVLA